MLSLIFITLPSLNYPSRKKSKLVRLNTKGSKTIKRQITKLVTPY